MAQLFLQLGVHPMTPDKKLLMAVLVHARANILVTPLLTLPQVRTTLGVHVSYVLCVVVRVVCCRPASP